MSAPTDLRSLLSDTVTRLFTDLVTQDLRESAEKGQWPSKLWQAVEENGLALTQVPEARGGGGGSWQDAYIVVSAAGRFAVPLPIAETMVAAWLLSEAGLDVPTGALTLAPVTAAEQVAVTRDGAGWRIEGTVCRTKQGSGRLIDGADAIGASAAQAKALAPTRLGGRWGASAGRPYRG